MKTFLSIASIAVIGLFVFSSCRGGFGHHGYGHHKMKPEKVASRIASRLHMDKDQKAKLDILVKETFDQMPELRQKHANVVDNLITQFESDTFDTASLNKAVNEMELDMKKAKEVLLASTAEFHAMLKPEQKEKIAAKLKKHKDRMAEK